MITLALAQMIFFFALQAPFTHGEDGIQAVPRGQLFGFLDLDDNLTLYYVVLAIFALGLLLIYRTIHSRSEEHTSELQSLMRISYAVLCFKKKKKINSTISTRRT